MIQITLTPEQEQFLQAQLQSGKYANPQDVITQAFKLLEAQEKPLLPANIRGSESAKKLLAEKVIKFREEKERNKNNPIDPQRKALAAEFQRLCEETQALHYDNPLTEEEIAAEIGQSQ